MKAVILAGGLGSRLGELTESRPKPMIEIGPYPIIVHIMKIYAQYGVDEFIVCLGYKGYVIKEYFANYLLHNSDVTVDLGANQLSFFNGKNEKWKINLIDTGESTMTGGRLKRVLEYVDNEEFFLTYGDGVADINITALLETHQALGKLATVTAVQTPGRFGSLLLDGGRVKSFEEKPHGDSGWINGGFFVLSPEIGKYIDDDSTVFEQEPLRNLAVHENLAAYKHTGFWHPMDTLRDRNYLEALWNSGSAPWVIWQ